MVRFKAPHSAMFGADLSTCILYLLLNAPVLGLSLRLSENEDSAACCNS
eukprot:COSAG01_NODE_43582_length_428_cov_0.978723_1_plen_48_part_01